MNKSLLRATIAGYLVILLLITLPILNIIGDLNRIEGIQLIFYILVYVFSMIFTIIFFRGFGFLGNIHRNHFLLSSSIIIIFFTVVFQVVYFLPPVPLLSLAISDLKLTFPIALFVSIIVILFGASLFWLREQYGFIAISASFFQIMAGIIFLLMNIPLNFVNILKIGGIVDLLNMSFYFTLNWPQIIFTNQNYVTIVIPIVFLIVIFISHFLQIFLLSIAASEIEYNR